MTMNLGPVDLLIIQGSQFCNIDCKYCYLPNRRLKNRIEIETVIKCIDRIIEEKLYRKKFSIVWHAGEPLAVPIDFYRSISDYRKKVEHPDLKINQFIQTNGMLITQEWCDFFKDHNINIGLSIDGPKDLHDWNRVTRDSKGTFDKVMAGVNLLKINNIEFSVISVISSFALNYPNEIYDFFVELNVRSLGLNIDEQVGINKKTSINRNNIHVLRDFWVQIYKRNLQDEGKIHIREIFSFNELILNPFFDKRPIMNGQMLSPLKIINLDIRGNFTTFSPELIDMKDDKYGDFILGNIHYDSLSSIVDSDKFQQIYSEINSGVNKCKSECDYFDVCGGGSPSNKYYENGSFNSTETQFCISSKKTIADVILEMNENVIKNI